MFLFFLQELWLEYLELYSSQSSREELNEICDQAVEFSPTYNVWWKYLEYSRTYTDKRNVCLRLIAFLTMNPIEPVELHSHFVLETLLYLIQLELYSGHYASAVLVFKSALTKRTHGCSDVPELSSFLLASDYCCAWLAYIHVVEFHRLPSPWFDPSHGEPSKMVTKEDFVFPWKLSQQSRVPGKKLLVLFQGRKVSVSCNSFPTLKWLSDLTLKLYDFQERRECQMIQCSQIFGVRGLPHLPTHLSCTYNSILMNPICHYNVGKKTDQVAIHFHLYGEIIPVAEPADSLCVTHVGEITCLMKLFSLVLIFVNVF